MGRSLASYCAVDRRASQASKLTGIGLISWVFKGLKFRSCYLQRQVAHAFVKELFSTYLRPILQDPSDGVLRKMLPLEVSV